jgi:hypothetical protein
MTSHCIEAWGDPMIGQTAALKKLWEAAYRMRKSRRSPMPTSRLRSALPYPQ